MCDDSEEFLLDRSILRKIEKLYLFVNFIILYKCKFGGEERFAIKLYQLYYKSD